jgi:hypothetical protein
MNGGGIEQREVAMEVDIVGFICSQFRHCAAKMLRGCAPTQDSAFLEHSSLFVGGWNIAQKIVAVYGQ